MMNENDHGGTRLTEGAGVSVSVPTDSVPHDAPPTLSDLQEWWAISECVDDDDYDEFSDRAVELLGGILRGLESGNYALISVTNPTREDDCLDDKTPAYLDCGYALYGPPALCTCKTCEVVDDE